MSAGKRPPMMPPAGMINPTRVHLMPPTTAPAIARVEPPPAKYPNGGQWVTMGIPVYGANNVAAANGSIVKLAEWERDVSTRVLVTVNAYSGPFAGATTRGSSPFCGVAARISWGDSRGGHSQWRAAPFQQVIDASYVKVDACVASAPYVRAAGKNAFNITNQTLLAQPVLPLNTPTVAAGTSFVIQAKATISEGSEAYAQSDVIRSAGLPCAISSGPMFVGPAIVDSIVFHNTNSSPIIMTVNDDNGIWAGQGGNGVFPGIETVIVPGNSSKEISPGTLQIGCYLYGITSFGGSTEDANDANVYADIFGTILQDPY